MPKKTDPDVAYTIQDGDEVRPMTAAEATFYDKVRQDSPQAVQ